MASFHFGSHEFDEVKGLFHAGRPVHLSPIQHRLLQTFCLKAGILLSKEHLIQDAWNHKEVSDISLNRTIHALRQKLGGGAYARQLIASVDGKGHVFNPAAA